MIIKFLAVLQQTRCYHLSANTKIRELRLLDLSLVAKLGMVNGGHGGASVLQPVFHLFDPLPGPLHSRHNLESEQLHSANSALSSVHAPPYELQTCCFLLRELAEIHPYVEPQPWLLPCTFPNTSKSTLNSFRSADMKKIQNKGPTEI